MRFKMMMAMVLACFIICGTGQAKEPATPQKHATQVISKSQFLTKVWDFEKRPNGWKFLGKRPCIIDFYADWCGPCRKLSPILEEIAQEYKGKIDVYKVNVDNDGELATMFGVKGIPMLIFCPMDGYYKEVVGFRDKEELKQMIKEVFNL